MQTICDQILMINKGKLVAFDTPENLEKKLLAPNEIMITTDSQAAEVQEILADIGSITDIGMEEKETGLIVAHIKTDHDNIYDISRAVFLAFATKEKVLLEMALKRGNLEDVFIELTEGGADIQAGQEDDMGIPEPAGVESAFVPTDEEV